jgi:hypothetical protein
MKKIEIKKNINTAFRKTAFSIAKHSPEILIVAGVIGTVVSAVMACKATTKVQKILDKAKEDIDQIHQFVADENIKEYTEEESKRDLTIIYAKTGMSFVKLYAPAVALGALSLASIITSNGILRRRNMALAAAYAAIDQGFKEYRSRVVERFGKEVDHEIKYNIKSEKVNEVVVDKDGNQTVVEKTIKVANIDEDSSYARFFDEYSGYWDKTPEYNLMFLRTRQSYANDRLRANGYLFLNDVYEMLGIKKSKAGQVVGWVYAPDDPEHNGDNYVDFGIYNINKKESRGFVNGFNPSILLDFNVDGNIWEKMKG